IQCVTSGIVEVLNFDGMRSGRQVDRFTGSRFIAMNAVIVDNHITIQEEATSIAGGKVEIVGSLVLDVQITEELKIEVVILGSRLQGEVGNGSRNLRCFPCRDQRFIIETLPRTGAVLVDQS